MATKKSYSKKATKKISGAMHDMKNEKKPFKQKVAIAINKARASGLKVPKTNKKTK